MKKVRRQFTSSQDFPGEELEDSKNPFLPHPAWRMFLRVLLAACMPILAAVVVLLYVLPVAFLICAIAGGTLFGLHHWHLSLWLAVPFGLVVGALFWFLVTGGLRGTLMEAGVPCIIILIVGLILVPVFLKERHKADLSRQRPMTHALP